jgi:glycosyltransferase involved in cell wall biosynthesis
MTVSVSVIIPCYNSARYLAEAIQSVLDQTYTDFEIIIVNDGSTDETEAVVKGFSDQRIRYVYQANKGLAGARNAGLRLAQGEFLAFLDADDLFLPEKLNEQIDFLLKNSSIDLVAGGWEYINAEREVLGVERPWMYRNRELGVEDMLWQGVAPVHAVLVRRRIVEEVGGFDENMRACEDSDLWGRLAIAGCRCVLQPFVVCQYRLHSQNMSKDVSNHETWYVYYLTKIFNCLNLFDQLRKKKDEIFANYFLLLSVRYYLHKDLDNAHRVLQKAIELQPGLLDKGDFRIADVISHPACSPSYAWFAVGMQITKEECIVLVCNDLKMQFGTIGKLWSRQIRRNFDICMFFGDRRKSFYKTVQLWLRILIADRDWILNRGGWSVLFRSLFGL